MRKLVALFKKWVWLGVFYLLCVFCDVSQKCKQHIGIMKM